MVIRDSKILAWSLGGIRDSGSGGNEQKRGTGGRKPLGKTAAFPKDICTK
jgi:hypothetical protein